MEVRATIHTQVQLSEQEVLRITNKTLLASIGLHGRDCEYFIRDGKLYEQNNQYDHDTLIRKATSADVAVFQCMRLIFSKHRSAL